MPELSERRRTVLQAPRVEFDLSALLLGAVGYFAYQSSWPALAWGLQIPDSGPASASQGLRFEFFHRVLGWIGVPFGGHVQALIGGPSVVLASATGDERPSLYSLDQPLWHDIPAWKLAVVGVWLFVLWSVIGGAIARVYAVRIARDESIGASEGVAFSVANLRSFLLAPLFVAAAAAFFLALAALAGLVSAVPYAGPLLQVVLYPLALLAALVVVVIGAGGLFGFPILHAALATERNGTLDAISRTFSYVFTRPVAFLTSLVVVAIVSSVILAFGAWFIGTAARAFLAGAGWNPLGPDGASAIEDGFRVGATVGLLAVPRVTDVGISVAAWEVVTWLLTSLVVLLVDGFVLSYFVGGMTDTYFLLRREVDGIEDSEVYVDEEAPSLGDPLPGEPTPPSQEK